MLVDYQDYLDEINALNDYIRLAIAIVLIALALFVAKYASSDLGGVLLHPQKPTGMITFIVRLQIAPMRSFWQLVRNGSLFVGFWAPQVRHMRLLSLFSQRSMLFSAPRFSVFQSSI